MAERNPELLSSQLLDLADELHRKGELGDAETLRTTAKMVARDPVSDLSEGRKQMAEPDESEPETAILKFPKK